MYTLRSQSGVTLVEVLVAIMIIGAVASIVISVFFESRDTVELDSVRETTRSLLEEARNSALYTIPEASFGVQIASTTLTLFEGDSYATGTVQREVELPQGVVVSGISLVGGGSEIVYNEVIGTVDTPGVLTLLNTRNNATTTLQIHASGLTSSVQ